VTTVIVPGIPFPLTPEGAPPCRHQLDAGALTLTSGPDTDLFIDPAGSGQPPTAGRLLGAPPDGDFALAARVSVGFASKFDAGVLLVYADEAHWAKLCFEYSPQLTPMAVTVVTRGLSDDCNSFEVADRSLWLRIIRTGSAFAFHASTDGQWWRLLRYFTLTTVPAGPLPAARVGFLAQSPTGQGCTAVFDQLSFSSSVPADLRDGS
jgi:regulation of enolase protein 1 (concanavalin A-like superfamily)